VAPYQDQRCDGRFTNTDAIPIDNQGIQGFLRHSTHRSRLKIQPNASSVDVVVKLKVGRGDDNAIGLVDRDCSCSPLASRFWTPRRGKSDSFVAGGRNRCFAC
jgi:hypothetical protein